MEPDCGWVLSLLLHPTAPQLLLFPIKRCCCCCCCCCCNICAECFPLEPEKTVVAAHLLLLLQRGPRGPPLQQRALLLLLLLLRCICRLLLH